jgi:hypothetical protein
MELAWVDYDNDGNLDLFVVNGLSVTATTNSLYHNSGGGSFTKMTSKQTGSILSDRGHFVVCAWGDYDNDGWIEVFVTGSVGDAPGPSGNSLYRNNGDGTFSRVLTGSLVNDGSVAEFVGKEG